jgi:hypothetical protein
MSFGKIKKNNINNVKKKVCTNFVASGGSTDMFDRMKSTQEEQQLPRDRPGCRLGGAHY